MQTPIRINRRQLAARYGVQPNTPAHWAVQGKGPKYIVINGRVLYDLAEVERWERERTHQSTAEYDTGASGVNVLKAAAAAREAQATA